MVELKMVSRAGAVHRLAKSSRYGLAAGRRESVDTEVDEYGNICRERVPEETCAERLFGAVRFVVSRTSDMPFDA